jgi:hypothetical protein
MCLLLILSYKAYEWEGKTCFVESIGRTGHDETRKETVFRNLKGTVRAIPR